MIRTIIIAIVKFFIKIYFNTKVINYNRFEKLKTGCIVAPNHISFWDTMIVPSFSKRVMYMMAKEELFNTKFKSWFWNKLKAFPVKRGKNDLQAVKNTIRLLKDGKSICMFPEGTRKKEGKEIKFKSGAVMIACASKTPIIPVGIVSEFKFRSKVVIAYGEPIYFTEYYDKKMTKNELNEATQKLEEAVNKLIKENS